MVKKTFFALFFLREYIKTLGTLFEKNVRSLERGDQCEHFGEKIIKKYQFLAKLELFQCGPSAPAPFLRALAPAPEITSGKIFFDFFETSHGCLKLCQRASSKVQF